MLVPLAAAAVVTIVLRSQLDAPQFVTEPEPVPATA
jgi:hypothetical protein